MSKLYVNDVHPEATNGFVDVKDRVFARMSMKAVTLQTIASASWTTIVFDTATHDTHNMCNVSANKLTIPSGLGGLYLLKGFVRNNDFIAQRQIIQFSINGTLEGEFFEHGSENTGGGRYGSVQVITVRELTDGDDVALNFYHNYGSSQSIQDGDNTRYMYALRLGSI